MTNKKLFRVIDVVASVLTLVGAFNWLPNGLNMGDFVRAVFGTSFLTPLTYIVIGLSAVWIFVRLLLRKFMKK